MFTDLPTLEEAAPWGTGGELRLDDGEEARRRGPSAALPTSASASSSTSSIPVMARAKKSTSKLWLLQLDDHKPPLEDL